MNNLKKIGLTALGTALVSTGAANAASMSVSGATSIFFNGENNSNMSNGWSMTDAITFSASGTMDNGWEVSTSIQIDGQPAAAANSGRSISIDTGEFGKFTYVGNDSGGPVGAWDDLTPSANEESWGTAVSGTQDGPTNTSADDGVWKWDYTVDAIDGLSVAAAYFPSDNTDTAGARVESSLEYGVAYAHDSGLTIKYAMGENNDNATTKIDNNVASIVYAMDNGLSIGYQMNESDYSTANDEDFTAYGVSYQVNEDLTISYGSSTIDYEASTKEDQDSTAVSVSYTQGGLSISASMQATDNVAGTSTADNEGYEINFAFAF